MDESVLVKPRWAFTRYRRLFAYPFFSPFLVAVRELAMSSLFAIIGMPGHWELLLIAFVILILFGHRLPSLMRSLGKGVVEFKKGINDISDEMEGSSSDEKG